MPESCYAVSFMLSVMLRGIFKPLVPIVIILNAIMVNVVAPKQVVFSKDRLIVLPEKIRLG